MSEHAGHAHSADEVLPRLLELDADLHHGILLAAIDAAAAIAGPVGRVLDIGAGVGTGTVALAERFGDAVVTAVDLSADMLDAVSATATARGLSDRVATLQADVAADSLDVEPADLIWSANALHEVDDPARAFTTLHASLRPGGLLAVLEMAGHPWVLPEEFRGLESALRTAAGVDTAEPDWAPEIAAAGFDLVSRQVLVGDQLLTAHGPGGEYAALQLRLLARHGTARLDDEDRSRLRALSLDLTGTHELVEAVHVRSRRMLWLARRS